MRLRATILMMRDPIAALDGLPEYADAFTTQEGRIGYFLASARGHIATRNWRSAEQMLEAAEAEMSGPSDRNDLVLPINVHVCVGASANITPMIRA